MRRTSFAGAMVAIAVGGVLAFAIHASPKDFDLRAVGLIVMLGGAADLLIRSLIADSPLLGPQSADIAAVVEPLGEPVLDAAGNPIAVRNPTASARPPLVAPLPGTMPPGDVVDTVAATGDPYGTAQMPAAGSTPTPAVVGGSGYAAYEAAVRAGSGDAVDTPEAPVAVTTLSGRPVRPRGRGRGARRRRSSRG
ncbi:hypothetical protein [Actinospica sp.]|jgi:hypothetical protein|uniref:hypothetical protein n=1 Tax=Actinospica sp. TaxID=1872142 RepID=UPI002B5372DE|nr:hypothetical protein [Actinospica sp.]HWG23699.1 hypothetical protein [Actinospica sp.]